MASRISRILDALITHLNPQPRPRHTGRGREVRINSGSHLVVTPAELWNHPLPDPFPGAAPKPARQLLAWAATHAAFARAEAAGARAAVAELAKQFTAADIDNEELISRMQQAVRVAMTDILYVEVPTQERGKHS